MPWAGNRAQRKVESLFWFLRATKKKRQILRTPLARNMKQQQCYYIDYKVEINRFCRYEYVASDATRTVRISQQKIFAYHTWYIIPGTNINLTYHTRIYVCTFIYFSVFFYQAT